MGTNCTSVLSEVARPDRFRTINTRGKKKESPTTYTGVPVDAMVSYERAAIGFTDGHTDAEVDVVLPTCHSSSPGDEHCAIEYDDRIPVLLQDIAFFWCNVQDSSTKGFIPLLDPSWRYDAEREVNQFVKSKRYAKALRRYAAHRKGRQLGDRMRRKDAHHSHEPIFSPVIRSLGEKSRSPLTSSHFIALLAVYLDGLPEPLLPPLMARQRESQLAHKAASTTNTSHSRSTYLRPNLHRDFIAFHPLGYTTYQYVTLMVRAHLSEITKAEIELVARALVRERLAHVLTELCESLRLSTPSLSHSPPPVAPPDEYVVLRDSLSVSPMQLSDLPNHTTDGIGVPDDAGDGRRPTTTSGERAEGEVSTSTAQSEGLGVGKPAVVTPSPPEHRDEDGVRQTTAEGVNRGTMRGVYDEETGTSSDPTSGTDSGERQPSLVQEGRELPPRGEIDDTSAAQAREGPLATRKGPLCAFRQGAAAALPPLAQTISLPSGSSTKSSLTTALAAGPLEMDKQRGAVPSPPFPPALSATGGSDASQPLTVCEESVNGVGATLPPRRKRRVPMGFRRPLEASQSGVLATSFTNTSFIGNISAVVKSDSFVCPPGALYVDDDEDDDEFGVLGFTGGSGSSAPAAVPDKPGNSTVSSLLQQGGKESATAPSCPSGRFPSLLVDGNDREGVLAPHTQASNRYPEGDTNFARDPLMPCMPCSSESDDLSAVNPGLSSAERHQRMLPEMDGEESVPECNKSGSESRATAAVHGDVPSQAVLLGSTTSVQILSPHLVKVTSPLTKNEGPPEGACSSDKFALPLPGDAATLPTCRSAPTCDAATSMCVTEGARDAPDFVPARLPPAGTVIPGFHKEEPITGSRPNAGPNRVQLEKPRYMDLLIAKGQFMGIPNLPFENSVTSEGGAGPATALNLPPEPFPLRIGVSQFTEAADARTKLSAADTVRDQTILFVPSLDSHVASQPFPGATESWTSTAKNAREQTLLTQVITALEHGVSLESVRKQLQMHKELSQDTDGNANGADLSPANKGDADGMEGMCFGMAQTVMDSSTQSSLAGNSSLQNVKHTERDPHFEHPDPSQIVSGLDVSHHTEEKDCRVAALEMKLQKMIDAQAASSKDMASVLQKLSSLSSDLDRAVEEKNEWVMKAEEGKLAAYDALARCSELERQQLLQLRDRRYVDTQLKDMQHQLERCKDGQTSLFIQLSTSQRVTEKLKDALVRS